MENVKPPGDLQRRFRITSVAFAVLYGFVGLMIAKVSPKFAEIYEREYSRLPWQTALFLSAPFWLWYAISGMLILAFCLIASRGMQQPSIGKLDLFQGCGLALLIGLLGFFVVAIFLPLVGTIITMRPR